MFGRGKRRQEALALATAQAERAAYEAERSALADALDAARRIEPVTVSSHLVLKPGEGIFLEVDGAVLVEERQGPGHWSGGLTGLSIPISGGDSPIRLNTGGSSGTYTPGEFEPTVADIGTFWITNERVVFQGSKEVRECAFDALLAVECDEKLMVMRYAVRGRQTPTAVSASFDRVTGPPLLRVLRDRTDLALAHFRHEVPQLITRLQRELDACDATAASRPVASPPS